MLRYIFILFLFTGVSFYVKAQNTIYYGYDDSGNRISRSTIALNSASESIDSLNKTEYSDNIGNFKVNIYPNPTKSLLQVNIMNLDEKSTGQLKVFSTEGKIVLRIKRLTNENELNFSGLPAGMYYLKIRINTKSITRTIIKE